MELLTKQSSLLHDRQVLARELEFLRRSISRNNQEEVSNFVSSNKFLVDEVLDNVRTEEIEKKNNYVTKCKGKVDINDL